LFRGVAALASARRSTITPLVFRRRGAAPSIPEVQPGMMVTDGGSIPTAAQLFNGFSPWGHARGCMLHDWLFVARHCLLDKLATEAQAALLPVDDAGSAAIPGKAIRTLAARRAIRDRRGQCPDRAVSDEHRAEVERAFPGRSKAMLRRTLNAPDDFAAPAKGPRARIVSEITFRG